MISVNDLVNRNLLAADIAMGAPLNGAKAHLCTAGPVLGGNMTPADFTEATYDGYAAASVTWGTPYTAGNGLSYVDALISIPQTGSVTPQTVLGYFITDTAGTHVLFAEYFPVPVQMYGLGASCEFVLRFNAARTPGGGCTQII